MGFTGAGASHHTTACRWFLQFFCNPHVHQYTMFWRGINHTLWHCCGTAFCSSPSCPGTFSCTVDELLLLHRYGDRSRRQRQSHRCVVCSGQSLGCKRRCAGRCTLAGLCPKNSPNRRRFAPALILVLSDYWQYSLAPSATQHFTVPAISKAGFDVGDHMRRHVNRGLHALI